MTLDDLTLDVEQHIDIKATPEKAFAAVLHRLGKGNTRPDGQPMDLLLEPKPAAAGTATAETASDTCGVSCKSSKRPRCWNSAVRCSCPIPRSITWS
jgi:hypothetical protein